MYKETTIRALIALIIALVLISCGSNNKSPPPLVSTGISSYDGITYPLANKQANSGINIAPASAHNTGPLFIDMMKSAQSFKRAETLQSGIEFDENGYPLSIPEGQMVESYYFTGFTKGEIPEGLYTVLYDGEGELTFFDADVVSEEKGKYVINITFPADGSRLNKSVTIRKTTPSNPIRNIRILMPGGICANDPLHHAASADQCAGNFMSFADHYAKIIYNPDMLRFLKDFSTVRYMDLMKTNNSIIRSWNDRPMLTDQTWTQLMLGNELNYDAKNDPDNWDALFEFGEHKEGRINTLLRGGVPIEVLVDLANRMEFNPWFCMPALADDDYIHNFASYVRDNLKPNLIAHIEYSNEIWGTALFSQGLYANVQGRKEGLGQLGWTGKRNAEVFKIWETVFGGTDRIYRILGSQAAVPTRTEETLNYENAPAIKNIDAIAIGHYYADQNLVSQDVLFEKNYSITYDEVAGNLPLYVDRGFSAISAEHFQHVAVDQVRAHKAICDKYVNDKGKTLDLIAYEGGQHLLEDFQNQTPNYPQTKHKTEYDEKIAAVEIYIAMNYDQRMGDIYTDYQNAWKENGGKLFCHFASPSKWNKFGMWGLMENLNDNPTPKYASVLRFNKENPKWW
ncbi:MAG: hypothetical protein DSZ28_00330 [Thiothrix sp.]|nr:MAG: hypothetical protein DSZ28_00330 [Thiothrix sp.]